METEEAQEAPEKKQTSTRAFYSFQRPTLPEVRRWMAEETVMGLNMKMHVLATAEQIEKYRLFLGKEANLFMEGPPDIALLEERRTKRPVVQESTRKSTIAKGRTYTPQTFDYPDDDPYYTEWHEDEEDALEDTFVSAEGSQYKHKGVGVYGTLWTAHEKELFFEFLGRYGINQLEKIQRHLPKKTATQIMCYYDLLSRELEHVKTHNKFTELMRYDEMPEAVEIHPLIICMEEDLSVRADNGQVSLLRPKESTIGHQILDLEVIKTQYLDFFAHPHFKFRQYAKQEFYQLKLNVHSFRELRTVVEQTTRSIVKQLLRTKIHGEARDPERLATMETGVLTYNVSIDDVHKAVVQCGLKRPFKKRNYFKAMDERLSFQTVDDELPLSGELDIYGRDKAQCVDIPIEPIIDPRGRKRRKMERLVDNKLHTGDVTVDFKQVYPEQTPELKRWAEQGEFIIDDASEDRILDNPVAWRMLMKEAEEIDKEHDSMKDLYGEALLEGMGMLEEFQKRLSKFQERFDSELAFVERRHKRYLHNRYVGMIFCNNHGRSQEEMAEIWAKKHGETIEAMSDIKEYIRLGQEGSLVATDPMNKDIDKCEGKITEDMMLAFNYTFASYD